ncbi:MAG: hypothetical protein LUG91_07420 [Ruminococcus sp.]|nr:hypothetical protein [Ruminococcus sp.]MCD7811665.1 hypothetical protein [Ruminococcus sp.]MCD7891456.1 hypothetical protein [Ruminococcus sp.]
MYTIINSEFMEFEDHRTMQRVDLVVDTSADIPAAEEHWSVGSMVLVADTREIMILNNAREWV